MQDEKHRVCQGLRSDSEVTVRLALDKSEYRKTIKQKAKGDLGEDRIIVFIHIQVIGNG